MQITRIPNRDMHNYPGVKQIPDKDVHSQPVGSVAHEVKTHRLYHNGQTGRRVKVNGHTGTQVGVHPHSHKPYIKWDN